MANVCTPEQMMARIQGLSSSAKEPMKKVMVKTAGPVQKKAQENLTPGKTPYKNAPFDTGLLRGHIAYEIVDQGNYYMARVGVQKDGDADNYALYVHEGTRPHNAPMEAIQAWAERKSRGGNEVEWFPVWLKIAKEGTEAKPFLTDAVKECQENILQAISQGYEDFIKDYCRRVLG